MTTNSNEQGGISAKRIEAENVVSGAQIQGGDAQTASALLQLAQAIQRGEISAEEIKARNLVSGVLLAFGVHLAERVVVGMCLAVVNSSSRSPHHIAAS